MPVGRFAVEEANDVAHKPFMSTVVVPMMPPPKLADGVDDAKANLLRAGNELPSEVNHAVKDVVENPRPCAAQ